ncbi:hypothetical protein C8Q78DRAFT_1069880 [Trametes maxima]|nr:hypothetical protein C8Q78DRAFT_1069880 [Trametes maxima]
MTVPTNTSTPTNMVVDPAAQPATRNQHPTAAMESQGSAGTSGSAPGYPPYIVPFQAPQNQPAPGYPQGYAPLNPAAQGGYAHAYIPPYGIAVPFQNPTQVTTATTPSSSRSGVPPPMPLGMPPLMPIPGLTWAAVPHQHLLVAHQVGCAICADYLQHYQAAMGEQSFRDALTSVQTQLQMQFWAYFEEQTRSRGGGNNAQCCELEQRLEEAEKRSQDQVRLIDDLEHELHDERHKMDSVHQQMDRYRSERDHLKDEAREREREGQLRPNQSRMVPPMHPDFPESQYRPLVRSRRPEQEASPRRPQSSRSGPSSSVGPSCPHNYDEGFRPMTGPPSSSSRPTEGSSQRPLVEFTDFEDLSGEDEEPVVDRNLIQKKTSQQQYHNTRWGIPFPPGPSRSNPSLSRDPRPPIPDWPYNLLRVPEDSDPHLCEHWHDFVPVMEQDARNLLSAAERDMGQACHRIIHLIQQVGANPALTGVIGERLAAYMPPGLEPASMAHLPPPTGSLLRLHGTRLVHALDGPRCAQPRVESSAEDIQAWMLLYHDRIPAWMAREANGDPTLESVELYTLQRHPAERAQWIHISGVLLAVPGLYRHILNAWHLVPQGPYTHAFYPNDMSPNALTLFHVAYWYTFRGVTIAHAERLQPPAYRARAHFHRLDHNQANVPFEGICDTVDVIMVPSIMSLGVSFGTLPIPPPVTVAASLAAIAAVETQGSGQSTPNPISSIASSNKNKVHQEPQGGPSGPQPQNDDMDQTA